MSNQLIDILKKPITQYVLLPVFVFACYQLIFATSRYESQVQLLVQQSTGAPTLDPTAALLAGFGGTAAGNDVELVRKYVHSNDMLSYLLGVVEFESHYKDSAIDLFSRLSSDASSEDILQYFIDHVALEVDEKSSVLTMRIQAFDPLFAQNLAAVIAKRAEWFINKINNDLAESQLFFVKKEHELIEKNLQEAKFSLLAFQRQYNLIDPTAESIALQQITNQLDAQIAVKEAQLSTLLNSMSNKAAPVLLIKQELLGLKTQLENERQRMIANTGIGASHAGSPDGVNEIVAQYSEYKVNLELALQAYTASQLSMEKARIEAYRQVKFLALVETATLPEKAKYPRVIYNIALFLMINFILFGIGRILIATFKELK